MSAARDVDLVATGARLEQLLEASAAAGPAARERAEELVGLLLDLYGAGLARLLELTGTAGRLDDGLRDALADDQLVAGLLLVHGLHPHPLPERVRRVLAGLGAPGARLVGVAADGTVTVEVPPGADLEAVEQAVGSVAPEAPAVVVRPAPAFVPLTALRPRTPAGSGPA